MASGSVITAKCLIVHSTPRAATTMTMRRHDHAAARSSPHGTCARLKLDGPVVKAAGSTFRSARFSRAAATAVAQAAEPHADLLTRFFQSVHPDDQEAVTA